MSEDQSFLGRGWAFPPSFDPRGATMAAADEDIVQSLRILMHTAPGERVMQPSYGCDLRHLVFEMMNQNTLTDIRDTIERAVRFFEPRVILEQVTVDDSEWVEGVLKVGLIYAVIATNTRHNLVFPLYLLEGTSVGYHP